MHVDQLQIEPISILYSVLESKAHLTVFRCVSTSRFHKFCLSVCVSVCLSVSRFDVEYYPMCIVWYGPVWSHMVQYGPLGTPMEPYGPLGSSMVSYGPLWSSIVPYSPI